MSLEEALCKINIWPLFATTVFLFVFSIAFFLVQTLNLILIVTIPATIGSFMLFADNYARYNHEMLRKKRRDIQHDAWRLNLR